MWAGLSPLSCEAIARKACRAYLAPQGTFFFLIIYQNSVRVCTLSFLQLICFSSLDVPGGAGVVFPMCSETVRLLSRPANKHLLFSQ